MVGTPLTARSVAPQERSLVHRCARLEHTAKFAPHAPDLPSIQCAVVRSGGVAAGCEKTVLCSWFTKVSKADIHPDSRNVNVHVSRGIAVTCPARNMAGKVLDGAHCGHGTTALEDQRCSGWTRGPDFRHHRLTTALHTWLSAGKGGKDHRGMG